MSCNRENKAETIGEENPLLAVWDTPYGAPPFEEIKTQHFIPALREAMTVHKEEINAIAHNPAPPTFANTIEALEYSGKLLNRIQVVLSNLNSAETNEELQNAAKEIAPELSSHYDDIYLDARLFSRVKKVWDNQIKEKLTIEQAKLLEKKYKAFIRSGAALSAGQQQRLRKINEELAVLSIAFGANVLADTNNFELVIDNKEDLEGLPETIITAAAGEATEKGKDGKWIFTLHNASVMPFLQYASNRGLRKKIWTAYQNRGNNGDANDNRITIIQMVNLRTEKAQLLGYQTYAEYILEERMAKTPEKVFELMDRLWTPALNKAKAEEADIKALMQKDGLTDDVQPYDWRYYTEKIRAHKYSLDEQALKPYFCLDSVRKGIFMVADSLYGLQFKKTDNAPIYHKDVTAWEVTEKDGKYLGLLYMDFFPRAGKKGGAWMTSYKKERIDDGKRIAPIISIVCNFTKPVGDVPSLLTFDETLTFFHEFGHALHGLLSNVTYESLSGTSVPTDFVELPSQLMENWAAEPEVLKMYAHHYKTGEAIPDDIIAKLQEAATFDQGFATVEYLAAAYLDMDYHNRTKPLTKNVVPFENEAMEKIGLIPSIIPRYRSTYYNHIFSLGYSAGYYSYIWSGVLDSDAFEAFKERSLFDSITAKAFRTQILEKGGTADPAMLYRSFRHADPNITALLKKKGLLPETAEPAEINADTESVE
ncbi:M3 family metallopeptidase [Flavobacterium rhizosphaerae]|uniref:M3 family metallopeptidase n=1 Tax=Flavobacterium rhizosphaerae TaxID=3163298 RepID=A0ABW8Z1M6_9FLAO